MRSRSANIFIVRSGSRCVLPGPSLVPRGAHAFAKAEPFLDALTLRGDGQDLVDVVRAGAGAAEKILLRLQPDVILTPAERERGRARFTADLIEHLVGIIAGVLTRARGVRVPGREGTRGESAGDGSPDPVLIGRSSEGHRGNVPFDLIALAPYGSVVVRRGARGVRAGSPGARARAVWADAEAEPGFWFHGVVLVDFLWVFLWVDPALRSSLALDRGRFLWRAAAEGDTRRGLARLGPRARGDDHGGGVVPSPLVFLPVQFGRRGAFRALR